MNLAFLVAAVLIGADEPKKPLLAKVEVGLAAWAPARRYNGGHRTADARSAMTLKLALPPGLETRLRAAASRNGQPADQYAVKILDQHLPPAEPNRAAAQMLLNWAEEAEALTDAESAENEQILRAIDSDRLSDRKQFAHLFRGKNR